MLDERVRWKGWGEVRFVLGRRIGREEGGIWKGRQSGSECT